jgi:hypothetical protein
MPRFVLMICAAMLLSMFSPGSAAEDSQQMFQAGAAISDITPPLGETIVGSFAPFPASDIHDRLHARCLVLDDGATRIGIVICDNVGIAREVYDEARDLIGLETSVPPQNVLMAATHTHSATQSTSPKYSPLLARGIADAVKLAEKNLEPAKIGGGGIDEPSELFNRRWYVRDEELLKNPFGGIDKVRMNPPRGNPALIKPAGPIDPEISFLSVQSRDGRPIALLANYSLHYVGGVGKGEVSADYFGIFSERIGQLLNADSAERPFVGMLSNGTSGDVNNIDFRQRSQPYENYEKMSEVAEKIAQRVLQAHATVKYQNWVRLGTAGRELTLKVRKPDAAMQQYFAEIMTKDEKAEAYHRYERTYAERVQKLLDGPDEISVPLQVIRVGKLGIAAIPFEVFTEIGLEIKTKSSFADTFTIELANDSRGYLPTPAQHELGGYETWMGTNRVQLDASEKITAAILELMNELQAADRD